MSFRTFIFKHDFIVSRTEETRPISALVESRDLQSADQFCVLYHDYEGHIDVILDI